MNSKLKTIKSKLENIAAKKPKRLIGFKEWCEAALKPKPKLAI